MADRNPRWSWDVKGFEPKKTASFDVSSESKTMPLRRRFSISSSIVSPSELSKHVVFSKLHQLEDKLKFTREDHAVLRQEAIELQEYSNAKLDRVTRYLGALADKSRKQDQAALEAEARIIPLITEKKRLFNDLLTAKGNVKVFCRTRPLFENEGMSVVEFPDEYTVRVNTGDETLTNPKKDYELDRVYGPHVGQSEIFFDVQPFVQSALDGYNVSVFAYGQTRSGKTYTMEGSSHDRGLFFRCFEELFDLSISESTTTSQFSFSVTIFELYNDQVKDLLELSGKSSMKVRMGSLGSFLELVSEKVDNPLDFSKVLKAALQNRGPDPSKFNVSHLIVTIHVYYNNTITGENLYSKLTLVDLAGSESLTTDKEAGERVTELLHVMQSLSALGDVLSSLTTKKDDVPYENSLLTKLLADSMGKFYMVDVFLQIPPGSLSFYILHKIAL